MRTRVSHLLGFLAVTAVICIQLQISYGFTLSRNKREATRGTQKIQKSGVPKKFNPVQTEGKKKPKIKIKISELKPCISKAFCEVNSITEEPTYVTNKEFYLILNRLKKFRDQEVEDERGPETLEDESESSEESFERRSGYGPYYHGNDEPPPYPYYRERKGKSLNISSGNDINKFTNAYYKMQLLSQNGSVALNNFTNSDSQNATKKARVLTEARIQRRTLLERKTKELNMVDDLAALIKISAEIGQALRSPRRCRVLFRKCELSYEQIIKIFNRTQSVQPVSSDVEEKEEESEKPPIITSTTKLMTSTTTTTTAEPELSSVAPNVEVNEVENDEDLEDEDLSGNRNKKSRTEFSEEEEPDYSQDATDTEPVKTYSLFSTTPEQRNENLEQSEDAEAIVDEAFKKFEKVFPSTKPDKGGPSTKTTNAKEVTKSSEEDEENSREILQNKKINRASNEEAENDDIEDSDEMEVEMEVPPKKSSSITSKAPKDIDENDSDAEIPSSEIGNKKGSSKGNKAQESSEELEDDETQEEEEDKEQDDVAIDNGKLPPTYVQNVYTREDEGFNTYGFYPQVSHTYQKTEPKKKPKDKNNKKKNKAKKNKKKKPQKVEDQPQDDKGQKESSEEEKPDPELPPQGSKFYQVLSMLNDGKGPDEIPGQQEGHKGNTHNQYGPDDGGPLHEQISYRPADPNSSSSPSFFQSIMGWFRGSKSTNQPPTYNDYKYGNPPQQGGGYPSSYNYNPNYSPIEQSQQNPSKMRYDYGSSEEEDEEKEEDEVEAPSPSKRNVNHNGGRPLNPDTNGGIGIKGPPPPLVIVPPERPEYPTPPPRLYFGNHPVRPESPVTDQGGSEEEDQASGEIEADEGYSSEEEEVKPKKRKKDEESNRKKGNKSKPIKRYYKTPKIPTDSHNIDKYYSGIFPSAAEIDKQLQREREEKEKENKNLLLSTFDNIAHTFSTSADKIPDWDVEDNPKNRIKVASLISPGHIGKYNVRNRNKNHENKKTSHNNDEEEQDNVSEEDEEERKK